MKKLILFRVENILVKEYNKENSLKRAVATEFNRLKKKSGRTMTAEEMIASMQRIEAEKRIWAARKEKEYNDKEFERCKFKRGSLEILGVLDRMKDRSGIDVAFVSDYSRNKVWSVLAGNGLRDCWIEDGRGNWMERVVCNSGRDESDMIVFSDKEEDYKQGEETGIKVESLNVEAEGLYGFLKKIGLKQSK